jgi:hypothetical protein
MATDAIFLRPVRRSGRVLEESTRLGAVSRIAGRRSLWCCILASLLTAANPVASTLPTPGGSQVLKKNFRQTFFFG